MAVEFGTSGDAEFAEGFAEMMSDGLGLSFHAGSTDTGSVLAASRTALEAMENDHGLGDTGRFRRVFPDPGSADGGLYFDANVLTDLMEILDPPRDIAEVMDELEVLDAVAMRLEWQDGRVIATLRVTFDE